MHRALILSDLPSEHIEESKQAARAMAPVIAHGVRGLRFSGARYKCGLVDANPLREGRLAISEE